jgi:hypothetical protein
MRATVWIGPNVVKEMKRIIESSEIVKYVQACAWLARPRG